MVYAKKRKMYGKKTFKLKTIYYQTISTSLMKWTRLYISIMHAKLAQTLNVRKYVCLCVYVRVQCVFIIFITNFMTGHSIRIHFIFGAIALTMRSILFYSILFMCCWVLFSLFLSFKEAFFSITNLFSIQLNIFSVNVSSAKPIRII